MYSAGVVVVNFEVVGLAPGVDFMKPFRYIELYIQLYNEVYNCKKLSSPT
jgi:hypothetical protein